MKLLKKNHDNVLQAFALPQMNKYFPAEDINISKNFKISDFGYKVKLTLISIIKKISTQLNRFLESQNNDQLNLTSAQAMNLSTIFQDLRIPLTRLKLRNELAAEHIQSQINKDIDHIETLISQLSNVLKHKNEPFIVFDISKLVQSCCSEWSSLGNNLEVELSNEPIYFLGQKFALKRVIDNLIDNAFKFSSQTWVKVHSTDTHILITVEDNGIGIIPEEIEFIMQPYFQGTNNTKHTGSGLGLYYVHEVISKHHGMISMQNTPTKGAKVTIKLPNTESFK